MGNLNFFPGKEEVFFTVLKGIGTDPLLSVYHKLVNTLFVLKERSVMRRRRTVDYLLVIKVKIN